MTRIEKKYVVLGLIFNTLAFVLFLKIRDMASSDHSFPLLKAYLDPSTGAMIISAVVGIFATIVLGLKTFWYKITALFRPKKSAQVSAEENPKTDTAGQTKP